MANITIEPATGDRFDDAQHAFGGGGDGKGCQCQWWMMPNVQWQKTTPEQRQELLREEMDAAPPPALIAYVDGEAAGWGAYRAPHPGRSGSPAPARSPSTPRSRGMTSRCGQ